MKSVEGMQRQVNDMSRHYGILVDVLPKLCEAVIILREITSAYNNCDFIEPVTSLQDIGPLLQCIILELQMVVDIRGMA
jgi:hypothetical protein